MDPEDYETGYDIETGYEIETGAVRRRKVRPPPPRRSPGQGVLAPQQGRRELSPPVPGVPSIGRRVAQMGLGFITFTSVSGTVLTIPKVVQKPFAPTRLILDFTRTGATAQTPLILVQSVKIGQDEQLIGDQVPITMLLATGEDLEVEYAAAGMGSTIAILVQLTSPITAVGDSIVVSAGMQGITLG